MFLYQGSDFYFPLAKVFINDQALLNHGDVSINALCSELCALERRIDT